MRTTHDRVILRSWSSAREGRDYEDQADLQHTRGYVDQVFLTRQVVGPGCNIPWFAVYIFYLKVNFNSVCRALPWLCLIVQHAREIHFYSHKVRTAVTQSTLARITQRSSPPVFLICDWNDRYWRLVHPRNGHALRAFKSLGATCPPATTG